MKLRNGYVSNSSSSSFVIAGYLIDDENKERFFNLARRAVPALEDYLTVDELLDREGYEIGNSHIIVKTGNDDNGIECGKSFIGKTIAYSDNYEMIVDVDDIRNDLKEYDDLFKDDEKKIKIITGTMCI